MKEIIFLVDDLSINGGVESVVSSLANGFVKYKFKVRMVCVYNNGEPAYPINKNVIISYLTSTKNKIKKYTSILLFFLKFKCESGKYIVISNSVSNSILLSLFFCKKFDIYACDHNKYDAVNIIWRCIRFLCYPLLKGIIVLTREDLPKYLKLNNTCQVFENPVQQAFYDINGGSFSHKYNYVINVGRLEWQKGHDLLIKAWSKINHHGFKLYICGDGSLEYELKCLIEKLGLSDSVKLLGKRADIPNLLSHAYFNVLSSRFEGKPVSLIEAKVVGCPNISFDCRTGPKEIINDKVDGILVKNGSVDALADAMKFLFDNKPLRDSMSLYSLADRDKYSEESVVKSYIRFFIKND